MLDFKKFFSSIADAGQRLIGKKSLRKDLTSALQLCNDLISFKGVASGIAIAREITEIYSLFDTDQKLSFFKEINKQFSPNNNEVKSNLIDLGILGFVPQTPFLLDSSIRDNICFGNTYEEVKFENVINQSQLSSFLDSLEFRDNTVVGERGVMISGGQRQRISIARAFLRDAPILLLDEATSSLDNESENLIQIAIKKLMQNRTTIVIAHRLSTIIDANKIAVFDSGKIVEIGTHQQLIKNDGLYSNLYKKEL